MIKFEEIVEKAESGDVGLQHRLADYYFNVLGKPEMGVYYLVLASFSDDIESIKTLSSYFEDRKEYEKAVNFYRMGIGLEVDEETKEQFNTIKLSTLEKVSTGGLPFANYYLGTTYQEMGNYAEAKRYYEKAIEQEFWQAYYNMGDLYYEGLGVEQDTNEAYLNYEKGANKGVHLAKVRLAHMIINKETMNNDNKQAFKYLDEAYNNGVKFDPIDLANFYKTGDVGGKNTKKAQELYEVSATYDNGEALYNLGLACGKDEINDKIGYFKRAYELGYILAVVELAKIHTANKETTKARNLLVSAVLRDNGKQDQSAYEFYQYVAEVFDTNKDAEMALKYVLKADTIAKKLEIKDKNLAKLKAKLMKSKK